MGSQIARESVRKIRKSVLCTKTPRHIYAALGIDYIAFPCYIIDTERVIPDVQIKQKELKVSKL